MVKTHKRLTFERFWENKTKLKIFGFLLSVVLLGFYFGILHRLSLRYLLYPIVYQCRIVIHSIKNKKTLSCSLTDEGLYLKYSSFLLSNGFLLLFLLSKLTFHCFRPCSYFSCNSTTKTPCDQAKYT